MGNGVVISPQLIINDEPLSSGTVVRGLVNTRGPGGFTGAAAEFFLYGDETPADHQWPAGTAHAVQARFTMDTYRTPGTRCPYQHGPGAGGPRTGLAIGTTGNIGYFQENAGGGAFDWIVLSSTNPVSLGVEYVATVIRRADNTWAIYLNGVEVATATDSTAYAPASNDIYIGDDGQATCQWDGEINEVAVFKSLPANVAEIDPRTAYFYHAAQYPPA